MPIQMYTDRYKETLRSIAEREREAIDGMRKVEAKMLCSDEDKK